MPSKGNLDKHENALVVVGLFSRDAVSLDGIAFLDGTEHTNVQMCFTVSQLQFLKFLNTLKVPLVLPR